jgi:hypothetical protein
VRGNSRATICSLNVPIPQFSPASKQVEYDVRIGDRENRVDQFTSLSIVKNLFFGGTSATFSGGSQIGKYP